MNDNDFIKRKAAMEIVKRTSGDYATAFSEIRQLPAADVAPVVHGEWVEELKILSFGQEDKVMAYKCSECGAVEWEKHPYCHCGAKMDGGKK